MNGPTSSLVGRDLLSVADLSADEVRQVYATATALKAEFRASRRHAVYLTNDAVLGARESVRDVARNLERVVDAIMVRTGPHEVAQELAAQADVPVINGLTLREHPCQALADVFTIRERFGRLDGLVLAFVGDGNNVYHSLVLLGAILGMEVRLAHPHGYAPNDRIVTRARELA